MRKRIENEKRLNSTHPETAGRHTSLKKSGLCITDPASCSSISNLNTNSMVLKRLYLAWLIPHVASSFCPSQSTYMKLHSTVKALLKIINDMFQTLDFGSTTIVISLDLDIVFDTIDYSILLNRLESSFGVTGLARR